MSPEFTGVLFALGTATAFGAGSTIARLGLLGTPVVTGTVVSMLAGSMFLLAVAAPRYPTVLPEITGGGWGLILFTSVINYPIGRLLLFNAMRRIGVARGNTIVSANPAIAATIAIVWLGESLVLGVGVGMVACVGGAIIVAMGTRGTAAPDIEIDPHLAQTVRGLASAVGAMMAYGTVSALVKKIVTDVTDPIIAASLVFTTGTALVALISLPRLKREIPQFTFRRVWLLVLGGTMMSLGILFFYNAVSRAPVTAVAPIVSLATLVAIALSQAIARRVEVLNRRVIVGAVAVVSGVILITTSL